jgi:4-amino-4-deoxy-L-arabinose transferase-like glycosyltransferase
MLPPRSDHGTASTSLSSRFGIWIVLALYLAAVFAVNPFRECPVRDDWAYAWSARKLMETGHYQAHDWSSANTPFHAAWGAAFCLAFGDSYASFRWSTIALAILGLLAFRALAREQGLSQAAADLLTLCVASCSIFFKLSLTYMSDVPFAALLTIAVLCYTRAVRTMKFRDWMAGAVAAAATVGTRQFGVAVVAALGVIWLLDRRRWACWGFYAAGVSLPLLATLWQLNQGWNHPNWAAGFQVYRARNYFASGAFLQQLPWRPAAILEYLAWFLVPLVLLAALGLIREARTQEPATDAGPRPGRRPIAAVAFWIVFFACNVVYGWKVLGYAYHTADFQGSHALMPFLPDCYDILELMGEPVRWAATVFVVVGAALFTRLIISRSGRHGRSEPAELALLVLDLTALFLLVISVVFTQFTDNYLVPLVPYAAIAIGKPLEALLLARRRAVVASCLLLFVGAAIWTREDLAKDEALWTLSTRLQAQGIPPQQIFSDWKWFFLWNFEEAAAQGRFHPSTSYAYFFHEWMPANRDQAEYRVVHELNPPPGERWKVVDTAHYFSVYARGQETFYAVRRIRDEPPARVGFVPIESRGGPKT